MALELKKNQKIARDHSEFSRKLEKADKKLLKLRGLSVHSDEL